MPIDPKLSPSDQAHQDFAIEVLQGGMECAAELHLMLAGAQVPPAIRSAAGMAIACVSTLAHRPSGVTEEEVKITLQLMFDIMFDHCVKISADRKQGMN